MTGTVWDHLTRISGPSEDGDADLIVSIKQGMAQCRVVPGMGGPFDETEWFADSIRAAQGMIDGPKGIGVALLTQQWRLSIDRWPVQLIDSIEVPMGPVQSIDSITYLDLAYQEHTLDPAMYVYDLDAKPVEIRRAFGVVWPLLGIHPGAVKVTFTAGFGDTPAAVPSDLKHAVKLMLSHYYNHRDAVVGVEGRDSSTPLPLGVQSILDRYAVGRVA